MAKGYENLSKDLSLPPARRALLFMEGNSISTLRTLHRNSDRFCSNWSYRQYIHTWKYVFVTTDDTDHDNRWYIPIKRLLEINQSKTSDHRARIWLWLLFHCVTYHCKSNRTYYVNKIPQRCGI